MSDSSLFYLRHKPKNITEYINRDVDFFYNNRVNAAKGLKL